MLKSKLDAKKYPCIEDIEEIKKIINFAPGVNYEDLDPVFLGRYAALCKEKGTKGTVRSGKRSHEKQIALYIADGGRQNSDGSWSGGTGYVGRPGGSWHEYGQALDSADKDIKVLEKDLPTNQQKTLLRFGLFKPLTKGNGCRVLEDWHIQPIETLGVTDKKSLEYTGNEFITIRKNSEEIEEIKKLQLALQKKGYSLKNVDGDFGDKTEEAVKLFQKNNNLKDDGIVGKDTWKVLTA